MFDKTVKKNHVSMMLLSTINNFLKFLFFRGRKYIDRKAFLGFKYFVNILHQHGLKRQANKLAKT